jgi:methyl coenzyme M reductase beta subunit
VASGCSFPVACTVGVIYATQIFNICISYEMLVCVFSALDKFPSPSRMVSTNAFRFSGFV